MKKGKRQVEQITREGNFVLDNDVSLTIKEIYSLISTYFPNVEKLVENNKYMSGNYEGNKYAIRCKNITYLGNPHPLYKKRIQIPDDLLEFYDLSISKKVKPMLLGIYCYEDNLIFVDFKIDTYIKNKHNNSSAHIYTSDLAAAVEDGYFQKKDFFGNTVTAFRPDVLKVFLEEFFIASDDIEVISEVTSVNVKPLKQINRNNEVNRSIIYKNVLTQSNTNLNNNYDEVQNVVKLDNTLDLINLDTQYDPLFKKSISPILKDFILSQERTWRGIECYSKMIKSNYRNRFQAEWVGFYLEYEFERYLNENNLKCLITYAQDKSETGIDLDLYFPTFQTFGDLKAHSEESSGIQGNDWDTIHRIIDSNEETGHVYYIVCEHSTEKDSLHDYEVTKFWNIMQNKTNQMSYSTRMKNNVQIKKLYLLDINKFNKKYLSIFRQGLNSNGKPRQPKILIEHENLDRFIVDKIVL